MNNNEIFCTSNTSVGYSDIQLTLYHGNLYDEVFSKLAHCSNTADAKLFLCMRRRVVGCICPWDRTQYLFDAFVCNAEEVTVTRSVQIVLASIGIILNLLVFGIYRHRKQIQNKIGNILLVSQAIADLFNTAVYAIPSGILYLGFLENYDNTNEDDEKVLLIAIDSLFYFSIYSSVWIFMIIAICSYLSIVKPMWHKRNVTKGRILKMLFVVFVVAFLCGGITSFCRLLYIRYSMNYAIIALCGVWIVAISVLFTLSYSKARKCLQRKNIAQTNNIDLSSSSEANKHYHIDKKMLRLTLIFFAMYGVFLLAIVPSIVNMALWLIKGRRTWIPSMIAIVLFTATSIINPVLTLTLREDFRIYQSGIANIEA